jgi:hypothetical protein
MTVVIHLLLTAIIIVLLLVLSGHHLLSNLFFIHAFFVKFLLIKMLLLGWIVAFLESAILALSSIFKLLLVSTFVVHLIWLLILFIS